MSRKPSSGQLGAALLGGAVFVYVLLIAYGSLFPFSGWQEVYGSPLAFLTEPLPVQYSRTDLFVNVIAYVPLGFLLAVWLGRVAPRWLAVALAVLAGGLVSLSMEVMQVYLPSRVPSVGDLLTNAAGTGIGAGCAWVASRVVAPGAALHRWRNEWLRAGAEAEFGFAVALFGMLVLLAPLVPSLGEASRSLSVLPAWQAYFDTSGVTVPGVAAYATQALGLLLLCGICVRLDRPRIPVVLTVLAVIVVAKFFVTVLFLRVPVSQWMMSGRALAGLALALAVFWPLAPRAARHAWLGAGMVLLSFAMVQLSAGSADAGGGGRAAFGQAFNWIPFQGQMHGTTGVLDVLAGVTQFLVLGCLANAVASPGARSRVKWLGALVVFGFALATEWAQQTIPGRYPDITDAVLPLIGWLGAWFWAPLPVGQTAMDAGSVARPAERGMRRRGVVVAVAVGVLVGGVGLVVALSEPVERPLESARMQRHPVAADLPPLNLPGFRYAHPRLPAPSPAEISVIRTRNPGYLEEKRRAARGGEGELYAAILMAFIEPGSQDTDLIFRRLMAEEFHYRANGTEIVALGYDWLHHLWSPSQRKQLLDRLDEGVAFAYDVIRNDRLSPYNVYMYNSPFQRLLMLALVRYGDDPRGEGSMRVVNYLLKHDVLPVWRQVMGRNGGWHEGGEYVGIGIGQAVYRVPAMWRSATGEDLFKTEPYLRGFLDFLVYRTRPDGGHFRWGDASFFDRMVPDQYALALEYRHAAAYGTGRAAYAPTAWPWGPLADPELVDAGASARLPLSKLFDGIGMVVARSDWGDAATYVSFKAGDNFWSHSHLDQGAFTIYKGGALAIDSGLYGPGYGSDHHMNYTYQTIAHNTLTIFDPADVVPVVNRHGEKREFANDGGQRRVGSGWGIESAPINRDEWDARREIYHTGKIEAYYEGEGLTIAVADVTAAYTNAFSGKGTFSHRTRRAERVWRVFAYDRIDDVVVVQDQVVATEPEFRKRWLLHTVEAPAVKGGEFSASSFPAAGPGRGGGHLRGVVVLPEDAQLNVIGGRGFEFFVEGKNYDEGGALAATMERKPNSEPGAWRVEVMPGHQRREDQFLVVMLPSAFADKPLHTIKRLAADGRTGCEIAGPKRTTRWWFRPGANEVEVEVESAGGRRTLRVSPQTSTSSTAG